MFTDYSPIQHMDHSGKGLEPTRAQSRLFGHFLFLSSGPLGTEL